jgi:AcrR family transcriptional regulator
VNLVSGVGRKPSHSRESFVTSALHLADERGIGALTVRALGTEVGASATAIYRYFPTKEALIDAIRENLLAEVQASWAPADDPVESLIALGRALRATALQHPSLGQVLIVGLTPNDATNQIPHVVISLLENIGVPCDRLVVGYRQIETFAIGSAIYDFAGAPNHLRDRRVRMNAVQHPAFFNQLADEESVERVNEIAFESTLRILVEHLKS